MPETRKFTNRLISLRDDGALSDDIIVDMCLHWMSENDVKEMIENSELEEYFTNVNYN